MRSVAAIAVLAALAGCGEEGVRRTPKHKVGDMVSLKIAPELKGMVIRSWCIRRRYGGWCYYNIRVAQTEILTNTRVLSSDDPVEINPIATLYRIKEIELQ